MPAITSASSVAFFRASTVASTLTTLPLRLPRWGAKPLPTTSSSPASSIWPIRKPIFDDPMSTETMWVAGLGIRIHPSFPGGSGAAG